MDLTNICPHSPYGRQRSENHNLPLFMFQLMEAGWWAGVKLCMCDSELKFRLYVHFTVQY